MPVDNLQPMVNYGPDFYEAVNNTFRVMQEITNIPAFIFYSQNSETGDLHTIVSDNVGEEEIKKGEELLRQIEEEILICDDPENPLALDKNYSHHIWVPISVNRQVMLPHPGEGMARIGVMYFPLNRPLNEEQLLSFYLIAVQAALIQVNAQSMELWRTSTGMTAEHVPVGVIVLTWSGTVLAANPVAREILGDIPTDMPFNKELWEPLKKTIDQAIQEQKVKEIELAWENKRGKKMELLFKVSVSYKEGHFYLATLTIEDITARRQREKALERADRLKALSGLVAGAAHEIRNPLSGLKGAVQYLGRDSRLREEKADYLDLLESEIDRIDEIVGNLQAFALPRNPKREEIRLEALLDSVLLLLKSQLEKNNIKVTRDFRKSQLVDVDQEQFKQAILNLLLNAIEAIGPGGGNISLIIDEHEQSTLLYIQDTGGGISSDLLERIWHPFHSSKEKGTGLGLSVVHSIISAHRGKINVENIDGGASFCIELPKGVENE